MFKTLEEILKRKQELRSSLATLSGEALDKAVAEVEELDKQQAEIEKRNSIMQKLASSETTNPIQTRSIEKPVENANADKEEIDMRSTNEYRKAWFKKLVEIPMNESEKRALTTASNSGGVTVPTTTLNKILEKVENTSIVYNLVQVSQFVGNISIPLENTTNDVERKSEGAEATDAADTLGELRLGAKKYIKLIKLTCELENQAIDALENYIVAKLAKKLAQAIDYDIINGNGENGAKGILQIITPEDVAAKGTLTYDDICNLVAMIPAVARKNAKMMMSTNTLWKKVLTIKDNVNRPIFDTTLGKVLGREVVECDDVPDGTIIYGDFSEYLFNWNKGAEITKSTETGFKSGDSYFRILALADGNLADLGAMAAIKIGTATTPTQPENPSGGGNS